MGRNRTKRRIASIVLLAFSLMTASAFFHPTAEAGMIRVVDHKSDAKVVVYVTDRRSDADLGVLQTRYTLEAQGRDAIWKFVERQIDADTTVYFTSYRSDADVVIYYVSHYIDAKWYRNNSFQGKFHRCSGGRASVD